MRNIIKMGAVLLVAAMLFTGCGDPMVALTEEEEAIVVNYSAGTLAKHNSFQQEGMIAVYPEEEVDSEEPEDMEEPEESEEEQDKDDRKDQKAEQDTEEESEDKSSEEEPGQITLTEALSVKNVEFSYHDYSTVDNYRQGEYFSMDAASGNVFLMLNINMTNTGNKAVECNLLNKGLIFNLSLNGGAAIQNEMTMLTNDLSTYMGTLDSGKTEAVILLFEVPQKTVENMSSMQLSVQSNGKTNEILLK